MNKLTAIKPDRYAREIDSGNISPYDRGVRRRTWRYIDHHYPTGLVRMSVKPPKTEVASDGADVRYVPKGDIGSSPR